MVAIDNLENLLQRAMALDPNDRAIARPACPAPITATS
jgi:hypothetical protein